MLPIAAGVVAFTVLYSLMLARMNAATAKRSSS
jgi:hypothetical protein